MVQRFKVQIRICKITELPGNVNIELSFVLLEKAIVDGLNRNAYNFFLGSRVTASSSAF